MTRAFVRRDDVATVVRCADSIPDWDAATGAAAAACLAQVPSVRREAPVTVSMAAEALAS